MKKISAYALFALLFTFATPTYAGTVCPAGVDTEEMFFNYVEQSGFKPYSLTSSGQKKLLKEVNKNREEKNQEALTDDTMFYFAKVDEMNTGMVLISKGCVVPETVVVVPSAMFAKVMLNAGILDEEMVEFEIGKGI